MLDLRERSTGWAALAVLVLAATGCEPAVSAREDGSSSTARVEPVVSTVRVDEAVRPAVHSSVDAPPAEAAPAVPAWVADAVFYQIFPERFANGDPTERPDPRVARSARRRARSRGRFRPGPATGTPAPIGSKQLGANFFENGVFNRRYGGDLQGVHRPARLPRRTWASTRSTSTPCSTPARSTSTTATRSITSIRISAPIRPATSS